MSLQSKFTENLFKVQFSDYAKRVPNFDALHPDVQLLIRQAWTAGHHSAANAFAGMFETVAQAVDEHEMYADMPDRPETEL